ncbi:bifunctional adenosylcobinamide kinase/adenosylcobinamide-phosphate guanylyltransferase [Palleronia caenipelagi]|uniref:Bifunctional adenosylcobalamin biosynthesis protein n=2 Tax=Palleronia caenipelagi TaxID=2489174 RepID=A0A547Q8I3_9RHOB|nr:bifunctional adenosylcobinamide kinase/adenosylcobinamide-phosphate guanylyltransferase [Palleronia caenipelagi]
MAKSILITGGARSGKSALAERLVQDIGPDPLYIATAQAFDGEMEDRIGLHQDRRGPEWGLIEAPLDLTGALAQAGTRPCLVDCLTLWLTNLMLAERDWREEADRLAALIGTLPGPVVFVTNEVGLGIVPETPLGRAFRDAAGTLNQQVAGRCDEVFLCVAGQPLKVKPHGS